MLSIRWMHIILLPLPPYPLPPFPPTYLLPTPPFSLCYTRADLELCELYLTVSNLLKPLPISTLPRTWYNTLFPPFSTKFLFSLPFLTIYASKHHAYHWHDMTWHDKPTGPAHLIYFCLREPHFLVLGWVDFDQDSVVSPPPLVDVTEASSALYQRLAECGVSGNGTLDEERRGGRVVVCWLKQVRQCLT